MGRRAEQGKRLKETWSEEHIVEDHMYDDEQAYERPCRS